MKVQTILFDRSLFTPSSARRWAREHGFRSSDLDATRPKIRARQADPACFRRGTLRTKTVRPGVKLVVGEPEGAPRRRRRRGRPGGGQDGTWRWVWRVGKATFYDEGNAERRSAETGAQVRAGWLRVR